MELLKTPYKIYNHSNSHLFIIMHIQHITRTVYSTIRYYNRWSYHNNLFVCFCSNVLDWIEQCFTSPPTQYRLYGRRFLQVKKPNQQYQSTEGESCKGKNTKNI